MTDRLDGCEKPFALDDALYSTQASPVQNLSRMSPFLVCLKNEWCRYGSRSTADFNKVEEF